MKKLIFFVSIAALLLAPWGIASAYGQVKAANSSATIVAADPASTPHMQVFGNAVGSVTAGDLFTIETSENMTFSLFMTNADELTNSYRYLTLKVGIYVKADSNGWEKMTVIDGEPVPEMYITMQGGSVSFKLPGNAKYKVTLESGSYRSYHIAPGKSVATPQFYLTAS